MLKKKQPNEAMLPVIPYRSCPAKTFTKPDGRVTTGRSVLTHCQIVGEIARELIKRQPPRLAAMLFPPGAPIVAAAHDIGKVSPYFVEKIRCHCNAGIGLFEHFLHINPDLEFNWGGHAGVSQVAAQALSPPPFVPEILGQHHGFSPDVAGRRAEDETFGGADWQKEREALVLELKKLLNSDWPQVDSVAQARLLAGLTCVADWIGSGEFFEDPTLPWQENVGLALDAAGFVLQAYRHGLNFEQIFPFPPRVAQQLFIQQVIGPGIYVLEAPMGVGKTEAALYAAYHLLETGQASGIYFALPTQLTSNKIFERFNAFLDKILTDDCAHRSLLLHSNAWLLRTNMGEEGQPGGAWFNQAKRGLLAPFAVGTIDQALMAAMNVKHGFVRAYGLAGKVVILDEVHTYDAYTGTLLDALVSLLRSLHCTVIILSATLNRERREEMINATLTSDVYPLITAAPNAQPLAQVPLPAEIKRSVSIRLLGHEQAAVEEVLLRAEQGQQIVWIENTVAEAQQRYLDLAARAAELGVACGLLHSRFTPDDRQSIEDTWVNLFGKLGWCERKKQGRILVGTQVLEQSLDIDADFMVSRFAPSDMLLQRLGRLWRHEDTPRHTAAVCEAWFLAPEYQQAVVSPEKAFGPSAFVYSPYVLCRSLEVWQGRTSVALSSEIRSIIEQTYLKREECPAMARWLAELDNGTRWRTGRKAMRQLARITLAETGMTLPESKAQTRYSETDSYDILLLRQITLLPDEKTTRLTLLNGKQFRLPWARHKLNRSQWRQLTAILMRQIVAVRMQDAPCSLPLNTLKKFALQHCFYLGDPSREEAILRVALVDECGDLKGVQGAILHEKNKLAYRYDLGYWVIKV